MRFEWDGEKNRINQQKHDGLAFESAALVFNDPNTIFRKDRVVAGEQRWHAIGMATGAVLLVVHVYRLENRAMRHGIDGKSGSSGNVESPGYRLCELWDGSNLTLTAIRFPVI